MVALTDPTLPLLHFFPRLSSLLVSVNRAPYCPSFRPSVRRQRQSQDFFPPLPLEGSSIAGRPSVVLVLSRAFSNEAGSLTATLQSGIALPNVAETFFAQLDPCDDVKCPSTGPAAAAPRGGIERSEELAFCNGQKL